jgi:hypothetical protein
MHLNKLDLIEIRANLEYKLHFSTKNYFNLWKNNFEEITIVLKNNSVNK